MLKLPMISLLTVSLICIVSGLAHAASQAVSVCSEASCVMSMDSVYGVTQNFDKDNSVDVIVRELGGGDPAMNGDHLYLTLDNGSMNPKSFDLGINVLSVKKIAVKNGTISIDTQRSTMNADGDIKSQAANFKVTYGLKSGDVADTVNVTSP